MNVSVEGTFCRAAAPPDSPFEKRTIWISVSCPRLPQACFPQIYMPAEHGYGTRVAFDTSCFRNRRHALRPVAAAVGARVNVGG